MIRPTVLTLVIAAALLTACGNEDGSAAASVTGGSSASTVERGKTIKRVRSQFGRILADGRGQAVYVFDKETSSKPECYGACAKAWPPVLTKGRPVAGRGVRARRLGTTRRRSGKRQVTIRGRPLYYYVRDAPGRVLCHNVDEFGGLWLVVRPDGTPVP